MSLWSEEQERVLREVAAAFHQRGEDQWDTLGQDVGSHTKAHALGKRSAYLDCARLINRLLEV